MRPLGLFIIALALLFPLLAYVPLVQEHAIIPLFSQYIGIVALIAMAFSQILATRLPGLEAVFGGLDRMYTLHKWLGIGGLVAVLVHDTIDAEIDALGRQTMLHDIAETLGEISLYGLLALVLITIVTFIPYHLWRWTHKLMGAFFVLSVAHYAFIIKPIANTDPVGLGVLIICAAGVAAYVYTLIPDSLRPGGRRYQISALDKTGGALAVTLQPQSGGFVHQPGQFAFVRFAEDGRHETHPFTLSQAPLDNRSLRVTIKALGDDTKRFEQALAVGQTATLSGPFGHFKAYKGEAPSVWIAAGVGITPFAAFAGALADHKGPVDLVYCVRDAEQAPHLGELMEAAERFEHFRIHLIESGKGDRLSAERLDEILDVDWKRARVHYCGPERLRETLSSDLVKRGLKRRYFVYEMFEIRSGIGLRKALHWLLSRLGAPKGVVAAAQLVTR